MTTGWGTGSWGFTAWGGTIPASVVGTHNPQIIDRAPVPNALGVREDAPVAVWFFDADYNLDTATAQIVINGELAYLGSSGFQPGYTGRVTYNAGSLIVLVARLGGWEFDEVVTVSAEIYDLTSLYTSDTWSWTVRANPICYTGVAPLPIEIKIQSPMDSFLEIEVARQVLFDNVLKLGRNVPQQGNKAARVIYQLAFETELSTILNPYNLKNKPALETTVCERENILVVDAQLQTIRGRIQAGIESLFTLQALPQAYVTGFTDYLDSTLPSYRVSLVANMVLLARAFETRS
jgi:hypothetical protein